MALLALLVSMLPLSSYAEALPLRIDRITPDGENAEAGRQIVLQFNRAVVPLGRMERDAGEIPITIAPPLNCEWRWLNTSALSCNLGEKDALQPATHYTMVVKPGIKAEDGATIAEPVEHGFTTTLPKLSYGRFIRWQGPEMPVLRLTFNQPVTEDEVEDHISLREEPDTKDIHLTVITDPDPDDMYPSYFTVSKSSTGKLVVTDLPEEKAKEVSNGNKGRTSWLVYPSRHLREDTHYLLYASPGLRSLYGTEGGNQNESVFEFDTLPKPQFIGIECADLEGTSISIPAGNDSGERKCDPMASISLVFNAPIMRNQLHALAFKPVINLPKREEEADDESEDDGTSYMFRIAHYKDKTYRINLPYGLLARQHYEGMPLGDALPFYQRWWLWLKGLFTKAPMPQFEITDIFGRPLENDLRISFNNSERRPNFVLAYSHALLEMRTDSEIPFYVNNLKGFSFHYRSLTPEDAKANQTYERTVPAVQDKQFAVPFGLRDILHGKSGAVYGIVGTNPDILDKAGNRTIKRTQELFAQVTPYEVHLKLGHFKSMLWVTDLATGQPVSNADVSLYTDSYTSLGNGGGAIGTAITGPDGTAWLPGTVDIDPNLQSTQRYEWNQERLFVRVDKDGDMALLPVDYNYSISTQVPEGEDYVWSSPERIHGHMRSWGTTAQGIYRAGDTIQYKLYLRDQENGGLTSPPDLEYTLDIMDPTGTSAEHIEHVRFNEFGTYSGEFTTGKQAPVGWYEFQLTATMPEAEGESEPQTRAYNPMRVLVSDFTTAPFKVTGQLNGDHFNAGDKVEVTTRAELHSGGAYTDATARVTAILDSRPFTPTNTIARPFHFDSFEGEADNQQIYQTSDKVGDRGELVTSFTPEDTNIAYGKMTVESAVQDERGKFITGYAQADYTGVNRLVGLHPTQWLYEENKPGTMEYLVVDPKGAPTPGTDVNLTFERQETKAARVKSAGNAYTTEYNNEWKQISSCEGTSAAQPGSCSFTPPKAGYYKATATIADTHGVKHSTSHYFYVSGASSFVWDNGDQTGLPIIPEARQYKVGDQAKFLIKNPYPGAQALVSVERYGILYHQVQKLEGNTPVITVPITPDMLPGAYLSVMVVSPRVEKPLVPVGQIDLGKPAMRMGYLKLNVVDPYKQITVTATPAQEVYKPRDTVKVQLQATVPHPEAGGQPVELAVAVVDEAILDLIAGGTDYYDPQKHIYQLDELDVRNYSLLNVLIGRQKFEKKGANQGGDGGNDLSMRSLFKFVSYWNPSLKTDKEGKATIEFPVPDNLTGWRVLAIAATPHDRFGLGQGSFKVNRPTEIRPVMPSQVMEGDSFHAGFSVMNRTDKKRDITIRLNAGGDIEGKNNILEKTLTLEPYKRGIVYLPVKAATLPASRDADAGDITFDVSAQDVADGDATTHHVPVKKYRNLSFAATYGTTDQDTAKESISIPKGALPDKGSISLSLSPTIIGNLEGAFSYMRTYPYLCWEQKISKGVMASTYTQLKDYLPASAAPWKESDNLPQTTLDEAASFQAPNGGMAFFVPTDERSDPYLSAFTAVAFNWLSDAGHTIPETVSDKLNAYLENLLKNDATPDHYTNGMRSTVRAVALAALAEDDRATAEDIARYRSHMPEMSLLGKAFFLKAALEMHQMPAALETAKNLLASSGQTGGKFQFKESLDTGYDWLMVTPMRDNCAILSAFTALAATEEGKTLAGDIPFKLVRTITQTRGAKTHWANTQENIFCTQALAEYARQYEQAAPAISVTATLGQTPFGNTSFNSRRDPAVTFSKPVSPSLIGQPQSVSIAREGTGRLYYGLALSYAMPATQSKPANAGMEVTREYSIKKDGKWQLLQPGEQLKRGALVRVDLYLSLPAARNFVVVDDPIPGGLEPVNTQLTNSSTVDANEAGFEAAQASFWFQHNDWTGFNASFWSFYHQELRHDAARFYADYLPQGNYHLSYMAQTIASGSFTAAPTLAQEMYDTDVYGKAAGGSFSIMPPEADAKP